MAKATTTSTATTALPHLEVAIVGAGIVGLVLALALDRHAGIKPVLYEAAAEFGDDVGAGMGMYPNGLRVLRDISPDLVEKLRSLGQPFGTRRWERADGSIVMEASEDVLAPGEPDVEPFGIRRWKLQRALYQAVLDADIPVHFSHRLVGIVENGANAASSANATTLLVFQCGTRVACDLVFAADGGNSAVRRRVVPEGGARLEYTGVTCLMGIAEGCATRGIAFPASTASRCHAVYFPTGPTEQCFMINVAVPAEETNPGNWGQLSEEVGKAECKRLAAILDQDGWDPKFVEPLMNPTKAVRIGYCLLEPRLTRWVFGSKHRIVMVGDAAHPPVPYTGQGAQQGLEDAGTIALLIKHFCRSLGDESQSGFDWSQWHTVVRLYERIRIPHAAKVCDMSLGFGQMQQRRADSVKFDVVQGEKIQRQVFFHETLPCLIPGATHDYRESVRAACREVPSRLPALQEQDQD
jgi:salicylate hydroxylase